MSYKNISVSSEAYERLRKLKLGNESFSEELLRLTRQQKVSELAGIFSEKEAKALEEGVSEVRKSVRVRSWSY